jgi:hypothetical protein
MPMLFGNWSFGPKIRKQLNANGCTRLNTMEMDLWTCKMHEVGC